MHCTTRVAGGAFMAASSAVMTNCVMSGNLADKGGGTCQGTLVDCTVVGNSAWGGGGTYDSTVNNCSICNNYASSWGGGTVYGTVHDSSIRNNVSGVQGGGVYSSFVSNSVLIGNQAFNAGGGMCSGRACNCLVLGNYARNCGGIADVQANSCLICWNSAWNIAGGAGDGRVHSCTICRNTAAQGGGIITESWFSETLNSIIWDNTGIVTDNCYNTRCHYTCAAPLEPGTGNIADDPLFVNAASNDFHLETGSPCFNAGNNDYAGVLDLDGKPRIIYGTVDMGAFEWGGGLYCPFDATPRTSDVGAVVLFGITIWDGTNGGGAKFCRWDFENDGVVDIDTNLYSLIYDWTYTSVGVYSVSLEISNQVGETANFLRTNYITVVPEPTAAGAAFFLICCSLRVVRIGRIRPIR